MARGVAAVDAGLRSPRGDEAVECEAAGVNRVFESLGGVRVGGRLVEPTGECVGGVVVLHGYGARGELDDRSALARGGLAVLKLRVRGFPGSALDTGLLCDSDGGWIAQGLWDAEGAALLGAVADVVLAVRSLKAHLSGKPVSVRGDSLGGGLAVMAAANTVEGGEIDRIAIGMPSLGDWTGRLLQDSVRGAGRDAARAIEDAGELGGAVRRTLRLADAVTHARRVHQPVLCLLACEDPLVPASSAAAVFNALGSDPGMKRREVIRRGHAGLTAEDLRGVVAFERMAQVFLDPRRGVLDC